jgi:hypothetical protein
MVSGSQGRRHTVPPAGRPRGVPAKKYKQEAGIWPSHPGASPLAPAARLVHARLLVIENPVMCRIQTAPRGTAGIDMTPIFKAR